MIRNYLYKPLFLLMIYLLAGSFVYAQSFPLEDCYSYTYKFTLGEPTGTLIPGNTFNDQNGATYFLGTNTTTPLQTSAVIHKNDATQSPNWTLGYSVAGKSVTIKEMDELPGGDLVIIGTVENPDGTERQIHLARMVSNGSIVWSKTLGNSGFSGMSISTDRSGAICFAAQNDNEIIYGQLDEDGNSQWINTFTDDLIDCRIVTLNSKNLTGGILGLTGIKDGRHQTRILLFNEQDGQFSKYSKLGSNNSEDFILHDVSMYNNRYYATGIYRSGSNPYQLFDVQFSRMEVEYWRLYTVVGKIVTSTASSGITVNGDAIALLTHAGSEEAILIKRNIESTNINAITWSKIFSLQAAASQLFLSNCFDGGYLITTGQTETNQPAAISALKLDSLGVLKNCDGSVINTSASSPANLVLSVLNPAITSVNENITEFSLSLDQPDQPASFQCKTLACETRATEPECLSTFTRVFRGPLFREEGRAIVPHNQTGFQVVGSTMKFPLSNLQFTGFVASLNAAGKLIQRNMFESGEMYTLQRALRAKNGDLVVAGVVSIGIERRISIMRLTPAMDLIWNKSYEFPDTRALNLTELIEDDNGQIYFANIERHGFCATDHLYKLNADGSLNWLRVISSADVCLAGDTHSITQDEEFLYLAVNGIDVPGSLFKIRKTTGEIIWAKQISGNAGEAFAPSVNISLLGDGLIVQGHILNSPGGTIIHQFDKDGNPIKSIQLDVYFPTMLVTASSDIVLIGWGNDAGYFIRLDSTFKVINSKKTLTNILGTRASVIELVDGSFVGTGTNHYNYHSDFTVFKFNADGSSGTCNTDTLIFASTPRSLTMGAMLNASTPETTSSANIPIVKSNFGLQENATFCLATSTCDDFTLNGPDKVCDDQAFEVLAIRNAGCVARVEFEINNTDIAEIVSTSNEAAQIRFLQPGSTTITAKMFDGCNWITHTKTIQAAFSNEELQLGNDTSICDQQPVTIDPGTAFESYLWNTGSTDQTLTINSPGKYWLDVIDGCGNTKSDTIMVTALVSQPIGIRTIRDLCEGDTIWLNTPMGFTEPSWGRNLEQNLYAAPAWNVTPAPNSYYHLRAIGPNGCVSTDTVFVTIKPRTPVGLTDFAPFCTGDSVLAGTSNSFVTYQWNTGADQPAIYIKAAGEYILSATAANGCISADTLLVPQLLPAPMVSLPKVTGLCENTTIIVNAGAHENVLWQDGSTNAQYSINTLGVFYVTATNINGCSTSDTMRIEQIYPTPDGFLAANAELCKFRTLALSPTADFASYTWNTSANIKQINITSPGIYWLDVRDQNGCLGRDSILVTEIQCQLEGIYFPNAFSPNNDGKNDFYKPIATGIFLQYKLSIFNRFGQLVFSTTDINAGWDGKLNGMLQNNENFVFTCSYQIDGQSVQTAKGSLLLLK